MANSNYSYTANRTFSFKLGTVPVNEFDGTTIFIWPAADSTSPVSLRIYRISGIVTVGYIGYNSMSSVGTAVLLSGSGAASAGDVFGIKILSTSQLAFMKNGVQMGSNVTYPTNGFGSNIRFEVSADTQVTSAFVDQYIDDVTVA